MTRKEPKMQGLDHQQAGTQVELVSVAAALSWYFGILVNKFCKIMKIFE